MQRYQAAKGVNTSYSELVDLLEKIERLLKPLTICTQIQPTPYMDEIVVRIVVELLSILALTTKELQRGQASECDLSDVLPYSMFCREIRQEDFWRAGRRGDPTKIRSTFLRRGSDGRSGDSQSRLRSRPGHE
jgi:hypothetical protein